MRLPKLCALTYASNLHEPGLLRLAATAKGWGWDFFVATSPSWQGFASKLRGVNAALPTLEKMGYTHAMFVDAYDSVFVGPPAHAAHFLMFRDYADAVILSCERACWPDKTLEDKYPPADPVPFRVNRFESDYRFINSGGYMGSLNRLGQITEGAEGDDQLWLTKKFLSGSLRMCRDLDCSVFQTLAHTYREGGNLPDHYFQKVTQPDFAGRVFNRETRTTPVVLHGNGRADLSWLDGHLKLAEPLPLQVITVPNFGLTPAKALNPAVESFRPNPLPPGHPLLAGTPASSLPARTFTWKDIGGFGDHGDWRDHDFATFYERLVEEAPADATIVEVGCFLGRSLAQLATVAKAANKGIKVVGVDHCKDQSNNFGDQLVANVTRCGFRVIHCKDGNGGGVEHDAGNDFTVLFYEMPSVEAAKRFLTESVWCVFLDDDHSGKAVRDGVNAWLPKVRKDGLLAGHDSKWSSVWECLYWLLPGVIHDPLYMNCWFIPKRKARVNENATDREVRIAGAEGTDAWFGYGIGSTRNDGSESGSPLT